MLKGLERDVENSCWNKAEEHEPIFILLGRDIAIIPVIQYWIQARISIGKNKPDDPQIVEAREFMEKAKKYQMDKVKYKTY